MSRVWHLRNVRSREPRYRRAPRPALRLVLLTAPLLLWPAFFKATPGAWANDEAPPPQSPPDKATGGDADAPLPPGVVRVFGSERYRTWSMPYALAISPDGKTIVTGGAGHAQLTDLASGRVRDVIEPGETKISALAFGPDGKRLAIGTDDFNGPGRIELWDWTAGTPLLQFQADAQGVGSLLFTPDGNTLITGGIEGKIKFWDAMSGKPLRELAGHAVDDSGQTSGVQLALSQDGKFLVSGGVDGLVKVWELPIGGVLHTLDAHRFEPDMQPPEPANVNSVAISPDAQLLASAGWDGTAKVWDLKSGELIYQVRPDERGLSRFPSRVAFSPDGRYLAVGFRWNMGGAVELRDARTGAFVAEVSQHGSYVMDLAFTKDGQFLASADLYNLINVVDLRTLQPLNPPPDHKTPVMTVEFVSDSELATAGMLTDGGVVRLWDVETGQLARTLQFEPQTHKAHRGWRLAANAERRLIAVAGPQELHVWDTAAGRPLFTKPTGAEPTMCFSPDGRQLALAIYDYPSGSVTVWDTTTQAEVFKAPLVSYHDSHTFLCFGLMLTKGGRLIAAGADGLKAWDIETKELSWQTESQNSRWLVGSSDGRFVAASGGSTVRVYDADTGAELHTLDAHPNDVWAIAFSPDGRFLAAIWRRTGEHGKVVLWEPATGAIRKMWTIGYGSVSVFDLAFSPDGRYLATANANGTAYLLEVPAGLQ